MDHLYASTLNSLFLSLSLSLFPSLSPSVALPAAAEPTEIYVRPKTTLSRHVALYLAIPRTPCVLVSTVNPKTMKSRNRYLEFLNFLDFDVVHARRQMGIADRRGKSHALTPSLNLKLVRSGEARIRRMADR